MSMFPWVRLGLALAPLALASVGAGVGAAWLLPDEDEVAQGVVVGGVTVEPGESAHTVARTRTEALLDRRVRLKDGDKVLMSSTLRDLGARVDEDALLDALLAVGRDGSIFERLDGAWQARRGRIAVSVPVRFPLEPLAQKLEAYKSEHDRPPVASRWDFAKQQPTDHKQGKIADVLAAADALLEAAQSGRDETSLPMHTAQPAATRDIVGSINRSELVSHYESRFAFAGNQAGRAGNITRAAAAIDGLVMMPGDVVSFNELVGPRSADNGFFEAAEIYRGETRTGIGGGTCQVAGTFHAAAFFAGFDVIERSNHSRPSGYIGIGLDATVAYPHIDLKMRNPFSFPVVVHSIIEDGVLRVELLGAERAASVDYAAATIGVRPYERKIRETPWLPEGKVIRKQKGIRGVTVRKTRLIRFADGHEKTEKSVDVYPPTTEVYYVPPNADLEELLPPLPEDGVPEDASG
ncbi:MAG TPA: VanW family protein [Polyangiaceae bacterium]|nr:VanW family protein [Polyangiaceae bacterium]